MESGELFAKLDALGLSDQEQINSVICSLIGHSRITSHCFGYHHCGRCDAQLGDSLASVYQAGADVIQGHNCETCRANFEKCGWQDKLNVRDPFAEVPEDDWLRKTAPYLMAYPGNPTTPRTEDAA